MVIGGDAAGGGDLGHGELAGVVRPLGFADEAGGHFGFASALVTAAAGGGEACLGVFLDESGFVFGHQGANMPKMSLPLAVVVSTVGQGLHADAAGFQGGDDVDQVAQVPAESVDFQMIRVSPVRRHAPSADATSTASQHPNHSEWRLVTRSLTTGQLAQRPPLPPLLDL